MKEIGQSFKEAREKIEITKEEVIKDLNITMGQLENLEDGNANAFKDVFFLKDLVKKYADRVILLDKQVVKEGTPEEVFESLEFKSYFGEI